jgi:hypothetical protein
MSGAKTLALAVTAIFIIRTHTLSTPMNGVTVQVGKVAQSQGKYCSGCTFIDYIKLP